MANNKIQFTKIRDVKSPSRNEGDAGSDFYIPNYSADVVAAFETKNPTTKFLINDDFGKPAIIVPPHQKIIIPSGIKVNILDKFTYLDVANKGGIATKYGLVHLAHVIDSTFQGELFFSLVNTFDTEVEIFFGQKIVQLIHKEYVPTEWEEITNEAYDQIEKSERGAGEQGSTGLY